MGAAFTAENRFNEKFFRPHGIRTDRFTFDLAAYIEFKARDLSLGSFRVIGGDTYAEENRFFSFRRDTHRKIPKTENQISAIAQF